MLSGNLCAPRRGLGGLGGAGGTAGRERRGASSEHVLTSPAAGPLRAVGVRARRWGDAGWNRHRPFPATLGNEPEAAVAPEAFGRTVSFCNSELGAACVLFALLSRRRKRNCFCLLPEIPLLKTASHGLSVFFFSFLLFIFSLETFLACTHSHASLTSGLEGVSASALRCRLPQRTRPGACTWPKKPTSFGVPFSEMPAPRG